jgi:hypothetical protein
VLPVASLIAAGAGAGSLAPATVSSDSISAAAHLAVPVLVLVLVLNHRASVASEATAAFSQLKLSGEKISSSGHVSRSLYIATAMSPGVRVLMDFLKRDTERFTRHISSCSSYEHIYHGTSIQVAAGPRYRTDGCVGCLVLGGWQDALFVGKHRCWQRAQRAR